MYALWMMFLWGDYEWNPDMHHVLYQQNFYNRVTPAVPDGDIDERSDSGAAVCANGM
ncbi:hypothetical protein GCM10023116_40800 [Kistimonas scapharcae]|uniref:Uncharacterized protein n=1 Tax=Kistimonas scapharcae TaxID=1036133 RepID=A0ABP8V7M2_9GAMM